MTPDSTPREVSSPQGLFQILQWNRFEDWGKKIATMGLMQFLSYKLFQQFFVRFWFLPKCQLWVSIQTASYGRIMRTFGNSPPCFPPCVLKGVRLPIASSQVALTAFCEQTTQIDTQN
jgi:hypothetical protein